jgi:hypothetical protein
VGLFFTALLATPLLLEGAVFAVAIPIVLAAITLFATFMDYLVTDLALQDAGCFSGLYPDTSAAIEILAGIVGLFGPLGVMISTIISLIASNSFPAGTPLCKYGHGG